MFEFELVDKKGEIAANDFISQSQHGNFRQTSYWGAIKKASGWNYDCYVLKKNGHIVSVATILIRYINKLPFSLLYCCRGPVVDWDNTENVVMLFRYLRDVIKFRKALCLRFDPEFEDNFRYYEDILKEQGLIKIQDKVTTWNRALYSTRVMLESTEEELFSKMRRTHRQNIKKAVRSGVIISTVNYPNDKEIFFNLMSSLELKRNSLIHNKKYYDTIYKNTVVKNDGLFIKAIYQGEVISGLILTFVGNRAWALFLANDYKFRSLMPNKLVLWKAICLSNKRGCKYLDLGSTQGTENFNPKDDSLDNIKSAYRPNILVYSGYYDISGYFYRSFRILENIVLPKIIFTYYKVQRAKKLLFTKSSK